ncbi:hypothetical protein K2X14_08005 [Acetobacter sp. TBRC 12305]|uniref:Uncharacterized protein n=1 Tax=Acetobacter garciniae TaxID=2817435 RepID=A0A939HPB7_9PROT|nr:hypothetical protein [Acetobacter garciniae]MBO1325252.1 hypothetical protein [Acetobacter garciniae]MBX0344776.1 hypothetical protein [Acetobacter garciniae]
MDKIEKFIFETSLWKFLFSIGFLELFKTGLWYIPNLKASRLIAQNPFVNPFTDPNAQYLFWNWLGPFVAWTIGANHAAGFLLFHLFFSFAFTFLFIRTAFAHFPNGTARIAIVVFSILPVSATAYFWISTDSITLFLMMLTLAFPETLPVTFISGTLLGMQHFEQGFFATLGLVLATTLNKKFNVKLKFSQSFCLVFFLGVICGKIILLGIFHAHHITVNSGRVYYLSKSFDRIINEFCFHFQYILWSVLGLGWMVALKFSDYGKKSIPFFVALSFLCPLLAIVEDQTRVLAIVTFPLLYVYWLSNPDFLETISRREASLLLTAWSLMPLSWVWMGRPKWSVFPYDIAYLLHTTTGWLNLPNHLAEWPFQ